MVANITCLVTLRITVRIQESIDYRKSYKRILMKFYEELECGLETNRLYFGDDPNHHPDPEVRSESRPGVTGSAYRRAEFTRECYVQCNASAALLCALVTCST